MKYAIVLVFLLVGNIALGQNECSECDKFKIVGVYDFGPPPGGNWIILLLTVTDDLDSGFDPHYSDLFFVSNNEDTITKPTGPSLTLPQVVSDTIPYLMELNTDLSNQNFPLDFEGKLVISTPTGGACPNLTWCEISYSNIVTSIQLVDEQKSSAIIYPNPAVDEIRIESEMPIKSVHIYNQTGELVNYDANYHNGESINLRNIENGVLLIQLLYVNKESEIKSIIKVEYTDD